MSQNLQSSLCLAAMWNVWWFSSTFSSVFCELLLLFTDRWGSVTTRQTSYGYNRSMSLSCQDLEEGLWILSVFFPHQLQLEFWEPHFESSSQCWILHESPIDWKTSPTSIGLCLNNKITFTVLRADMSFTSARISWSCLNYKFIV